MVSKSPRKLHPAPVSQVTARPSGDQDRISNLAEAIADVRYGRRLSPRTTKLLAAGVPKMAQKVIEEAAEVAIDAVRGERGAVVAESVDLLYNLVALWSALDVMLDDVWAEMDRRERLLGMVEKLPKPGDVPS